MTSPEKRELETINYPSSNNIRESDDNLLSDQLCMHSGSQSHVKNVDILNESSHISEEELSDTDLIEDEARRMGFNTRSIKDTALSNFKQFK